jgi:hypothetical protein
MLAGKFSVRSVPSIYNEEELQLRDKRQTRPLVREGRPHRQDCNFLKIKINKQISGHMTPDGVRHQDRQTDWLSVAMWLWLWLRDSLETAIKVINYSQNSRRPVRTWTRKLRKLRRWKPLPGNNLSTYSRLRSFRTCYSELQSLISISAIVFVVAFCKSSVNSITNPNPVYSHAHTRQYKR